MKRPAFTILELLLVITLIAILMGISAPILQSFQLKNDLTIAKQILVEAFRRAEVLSEAMVLDSSYGVFIGDGSIILFRGEDYLSRDVSADELYAISSNIQITGLNEITFQKGTGDPSTTGSFILTDSLGDSLTIQVNAEGAFIY